MLTRVPNRVSVVMHNVRAVESIEWANNHWTGDLTVDDDGNLVSGDSAKDRNEGYARRRIITGSGTFDDKITVFNLEEGAVAHFTSFDNIRIESLPRGKVGGKHKATTSDGISFSGMSSRDVPARGLMEGEPGKLWVDDGKHEPTEKPETLNAELYIDEEQFDEIFHAIRDGAQNIEAVHLGIVAELFESEVDASLSDWWMSHEYGMLKKKDWVQTRARLDSIRASFCGKLLPEPTDTNEMDEQEDESDIEKDQSEKTATINTLAYVAETYAQLKRLNARGGWTLAALVILVIVTLLK
ncbi:MAG: hypothetical protein JWS10_2166 [Cypionkella sp.]|nr:hypothetical protein [Cypionkella sp.]